MMRKFMRQMFGPTLTDNEGNAVRAVWMDDCNYAILINPNTNRVYASIWDDECGKAYPTIYVSIFELARAYRSGMIVAFSLQTFPLCALELFRLKQAMDYAKAAMEYLLDDLRII